MSPEDPFRSASISPSVELQCPHCKRNLHIPPPESLVTLTACPHLDCQHVALICTGKAINRSLLPWWEAEGSTAVTFERFVDTRTRKIEARHITEHLAAIGLFVVAPVMMWVHAWREGLGLLMLVLSLTLPTALMGLWVLFFSIVDPIDNRRERLRIAAVRRQAFARARWATAKIYPNRTL